MAGLAVAVALMSTPVRAEAPENRGADSLEALAEQQAKGHKYEAALATYVQIVDMEDVPAARRGGAWLKIGEIEWLG